MNQITGLLLCIRKTVKLYESMLKPVCDHYRLTLIEADIISFLQNNPGKDTAGDIVGLRMLSKGNVSQAVESLIQKSLLPRQQDSSERRKNHLLLTPAAQRVTAEIDEIRERYLKKIFAGFSPEERELFAELNSRIIENAKNAMGKVD